MSHFDGISKETGKFQVNDIEYPCRERYNRTKLPVILNRKEGALVVKLSNRWDHPMSAWIPYLQWGEIESGKLDFWDISRHNHAFYELHIITEGACGFLADNLELPLKKGQAIIVGPEVFHGPAWISEAFCRFSVSFHLDAGLCARIKQRFVLLDAGEDILSLCGLICAEAQKKEQFLHKEILSAQFSQLMIWVLRTLQDAPQDEKTLDLKQMEDMLVIDDFFSTTPPENCTKKALAEKLHCSERQLLRKIYTLYGVSFRDKLAQSRIDMAKHLLRSTAMRIQDISNAVGYADNAAFYRVFRIHTGVTPMEYRRNSRQGKESVG